MRSASNRVEALVEAAKKAVNQIVVGAIFMTRCDQDQHVEKSVTTRVLVDS